MSAPAVTVQAVELVKRFRSGTREQLALEQVSLEVPSGKLSALVGPDGAGKTTL